jgi:3-oxoadipate enol-lactonase
MPDFTLGAKLKLHYLDVNPQAQQTVLLLHGLGVTGESWGLQIPALVQAGFRVLSPDVRGFGGSTYPGGRTTISDMAAEMAELLNWLGIHQAQVAGISMGGTIALQLALDNPALVVKLVLINTFARLRPAKLNDWFYFATRFFLVHFLGIPAQAKYVAKRIFPRPEQEEFRKIMEAQINQADLQGYRSAMRALAFFNVLPRLHEIQIPTLVITAENDTTVPPVTQNELVKGIHDARQALVPSAGHAVIVDQPEQVNQILIEFFAAS